MKIKVYTQLTLTRREVCAILPGARVAAPIERGDLLEDLERGVNVVAIIDGRFDQVYAVTASEVMDALRCGVRVYGSSSMGALRAVETAPFGTIGVGAIYDFIRETPGFRDDLLGQTFVSAGQKMKSHTYVDFFFAARSLASRGRVNRAIAGELCARYAALHFSERTPQALLSSLRRAGRPRPQLLHAAELVFRSNYSQKRLDAIALLRRVRSDLAGIKRMNARLNRGMRASRSPFDFYPPGLFQGMSLKDL